MFTVCVCVQVSLWEVRLSDLDEYLLSLNAIQRRWVYLEPIFGRGALPREEARFKRVDEDFRYTVRVCVTVSHPESFFIADWLSARVMKVTFLATLDMLAEDLLIYADF